MDFKPVTTGRGLPGRYVLYGPEGWGKTSFGAYAPSPIFIQVSGETGLETLIDAGQLPETAHIPGEVETWSDLLKAIAWITDNGKEYKTFVLDTLDRAQDLCYRHVLANEYGGDHDKFMAWRNGYETAPRTWRQLIVALDRLRATRKMSILCLAHAKVTKKRNPIGEDWTVYTPNLHEKMWPVVKEWADAILFGDFSLVVNKEGKASGGTIRTIHTQHTPMYDAKNRYGLPEEINCGSSPQEAWNNFMAARAAGKKGK